MFNRFKLFVGVGLLFLFFTASAFAGGCPSDIEKDYEIRNFSCYENCDDFTVVNQNNTDIDSTEYLFIDNEDCKTCNEVSFFGGIDLATRELSVSVSGQIEGDDLARFMNEEEMQFDVKSGVPIDFKVGRYLFEVTVAGKGDPYEELDLEVVCKGECDNVKVYWSKYDDELLLDTCAQVNSCKRLYVSHGKVGYCPWDTGPYASYGGYNVSYSTEPSGEFYEYKNSHFKKRQMGDYRHVTGQLDGTKFKFDLVDKDLKEIPARQSDYLILFAIGFAFLLSLVVRLKK